MWGRCTRALCHCRPSLLAIGDNDRGEGPYSKIALSNSYFIYGACALYVYPENYSIWWSVCIFQRQICFVHQFFALSLIFFELQSPSSSSYSILSCTCCPSAKSCFIAERRVIFGLNYSWPVERPSCSTDGDGNLCIRISP